MYIVCGRVSPHCTDGVGVVTISATVVVTGDVVWTCTAVVVCGTAGAVVLFDTRVELASGWVTSVEFVGEVTSVILVDELLEAVTTEEQPSNTASKIMRGTAMNLWYKSN